MTLAEMLAAHTDAALEALASKGLVRRARRDLGAGLASVDSRSDEGATVVADGQSVSIDSQGPTHASCGCPATGLCRHVLLAVMALRDDGEASPQAPDESPSAAEELGALSQAAIRKFAGADWSKACTLVSSEPAASVVEREPNLSVELEELGVSVTFIAGQGLKGAAYKGPKTRARVLVTACALLVRQRQGVTLDAEAEAAAATRVEVSEEFLERASRTVKRGVSAVLPGRSPVAAELFFDLAISTRVEALPRLSAELRGLARQATLATTRDVAFEPDLFLKAAARTYALLQGLKASPDDVLLRGTVKRDFQPAAELELWLLGAARWRSGTGARGMTAYGFSPATRRWHSVSEGRSAGVDPSFDPATPYSSSLWGAGALDSLLGRGLHLPAPRIAADGAIATVVEQNATLLDERPNLERLVDSGAAFRRWPDLYRDLGERFGAGLRRRAVPLPALVAPRGFRELAFDDLEQVYEWCPIDHEGNQITLTLPGDEHDIADELWRMRRSVRALLLEVTLGPHGPRFRPVTAFIEGKRALSLWNLDFEALPRRRRSRGIMAALADRWAQRAKPQLGVADALSTTVSATLDAATAALSHAVPSDIDSLASRCEAAGLRTLGTALTELETSPDIENALKTAFLAGEIEAGLFFETAPAQA